MSRESRTEFWRGATIGFSVGLVCGGLAVGSIFLILNIVGPGG